jgi:hypothetical protein
MFGEIKSRVDHLKESAPEYFDPDGPLLFDVPDSHSVAIVCSHQGRPLYALRAGKYEVHDTEPQVNNEPLDRYKQAVAAVVATI